VRLILPAFSPLDSGTAVPQDGTEGLSHASARAAGPDTCDRIVRGNREQRRIGFRTIDIGQLRDRGAVPRVGRLDQDGNLQIGGYPSLMDRLDGLSIADSTSGNCVGGPRAGGRHAIDRLRA
jgi:hypothetical protein